MADRLPDQVPDLSNLPSQDGGSASGETAAASESKPPAPGPDTPPPKPKQKRPGFFAQLFAKRSAMDVRVVPIIGDTDDAETRRIITALDGADGIRCRAARRAFKIDPKTPIAEQRQKILGDGLAFLAKSHADLLVWGEKTASGDGIDLRFIAPENAAGFCHGISCTAGDLTLPLPLDNALYPALVAVTLAATSPTGADPKAKARKETHRKALESLLEDIIETAKAPPRFLMPHDRATLQGCLAGTVAKAAQLWNDTPLFETAAHLYQIALRGLARDVGAPGATVANRNLGVVLESLTDRNKAEQKRKGTPPETITRGFKDAAAAYEAALQGAPDHISPIDRAWVQFRLGQTCYKADVLSGTTDLTKKAVPAFQAALKGLPAVALPPLPPPAGATPMQLAAQTSLALVRAEVLNALAEALQYMGSNERDMPLVERAIATYRGALEIRTEARVPQLWAATQNNLGAAHFLLGRLGGAEDNFQTAQTAFAAARDTYARLGYPKRAALAEKHLSYVDDHLNAPKSEDTELPTLDWEIEDDNVHD